MQEFDVVVVGSGPGGYVAAIKAAQLGLKTACVEKDPFLGGTCLNRGCIPTKSLLADSKLVYKIEQGAKHGITVKDLNVDMQAVHKRKDGIIDTNRKGIQFLFKKNKITPLEGLARFKSKTELEIVDDKGAVKETIKAKNTIIATGSVPKRPKALWIGDKRVMTSDEILFYPEIPKSMVIVGGGVIGIEFATMYCDFGTDVTIVEALDEILPPADADVKKQMRRYLEKKRGITIQTGAAVKSLKAGSDGIAVETEAKGKSETKTVDVVLLSIGRAPNTEGLQADKAGVKLNQQGFVEVNGSTFRTNVENIYAIGDVAANTTGLAHSASAEGIRAAICIAGKEGHEVNHHLVPSVVYCHPEIAWVGHTEASAKEAGHDIDTGMFKLSVLAKGQIENELDGFVKIIVDKKYKEVIGVHIMGGPAGDMIAEAALGMSIEMTIEELSNTVHPHPTLSEAIMEAAHGLAGGAIHG